MEYLAHEAHEVPVLPCAGAVDGGVAHELRVYLHRSVEAHGAFLTQTETHTHTHKKENEKNGGRGQIGLSLKNMAAVKYRRVQHSSTVSSLR